MSEDKIILIIALYFSGLLLISIVTGKNADNKTFFKANNSAPWYLVAFGMIGASLSGVTFISVPGWVSVTQMSYMQVILGYFIGYIFISFVLMPLYYRQNVVSIYSYLERRLGPVSYKTGAAFFLISRIFGSSFRLYLAIYILQYFVFSAYGVPLWLTAVLSIGLIWLYTFKGGIKTVIWTDTLQTLFMLCAVFVSIAYILNDLNLSLESFFSSEKYKHYGKIFFFDDYVSRQYFWKQFIGGAFIAICMTGMDQDMMQKNLSCKNIFDAQKNMLTFSSVLILVNFLFLILGILLYLYLDAHNIVIPEEGGLAKTDLTFPYVALKTPLSQFIGVVFILGLIAAAYSSADGTLTALTTSFSYDILSIEKHSEKKQITMRRIVHLAMSLVVLVVVILSQYLDKNIIDGILTAASYTYGPLLGLFAFGLLTRYAVKDKWVWLACLLSPIISYLIGKLPDEKTYQFGYEMLLVNGLISFLFLFFLRQKKSV